MQFGLFSNGERHNPIAKTTYDEDLAEIILADELGIQEAWISEHGTFITYHAPDQLPSAELFICKAAAMEYMMDREAFFCGDPDTVYRQVKEFYDEVGGFGVLLLLAGKDWGTREQRHRSMRMFMSEVAPRLAALKPDGGVV